MRPMFRFHLFSGPGVYKSQPAGRVEKNGRQSCGLGTALGIIQAGDPCLEETLSSKNGETLR